MDAGAHGVIVPMVNSPQEAKNAVSAVNYPPIGNRGVGLARAQGYGSSFDDYKKWLAEESIVIVQIEHIKAVEQLKEILSVEGIDAFLVGPYDLSGSLGIPGNFDDPKMKKIMEQIKNEADEINKTAGIHVVSSDHQLVQDKIKEGFKFIAYGVDFLFINDNCRSGLWQLKGENGADEWISTRLKESVIDNE